LPLIFKFKKSNFEISLTKTIFIPNITANNISNLYASRRKIVVICTADVEHIKFSATPWQALEWQELPKEKIKV
jgi:hypothetical protein